MIIYNPNGTPLTVDLGTGEDRPESRPEESPVLVLEPCPDGDAPTENEDRALDNAAQLR